MHHNHPAHEWIVHCFQANIIELDRRCALVPPTRPGLNEKRIFFHLRYLPPFHSLLGLFRAIRHKMSHLLGAKVLFLTEMVVVEVVAPKFRRIPDAALYNVGLLSFLRNE